MNREEHIYIAPKRRLGLDPLPRQGWRLLSALLACCAVVTGVIWWGLST